MTGRNGCWKEKATSAAKLEEAETSYRAAQARLEMYKAQRDKLLIQEERQDVIAPIDGEILVLYPKKFTAQIMPRAIRESVKRVYRTGRRLMSLLKMKKKVTGRELKKYF